MAGKFALVAGTPPGAVLVLPARDTGPTMAHNSRTRKIEQIDL